MNKNEAIKFGLALSGGGFRASFFHIGVLARLADLGLLRHIEVISTVSGGSVIGALYYLHVKKLLEEKTDSEIKDEDYQEIIKRIEVDFLQAIQKNLRLRTFLNPFKNLKMCLPNYSRSDHIGELYDKYLYQKVLDPNNKKPIKMKCLEIKPYEETTRFHPNEDNKNRKAKVPLLLINATILNNGHNWRFDVSGMGELNTCRSYNELDRGFTLEKVDSYKGICRHQNFPLGKAVAASACVPGIFAPLAISDLYDKEIRVQLVDGGVCDNQGINGLMDEKCTHFIISDASKQIEDIKEPNIQLNNVIRRSNTILAHHLRKEQLLKMLDKYSDKVVLLDLKKGIQTSRISYYDKDHNLKTKTNNCKTEPSTEAYGINTEIQVLLSRTRTDLDSFSDAEAFSLMCDGYKMSQFELNRDNIKQFSINPTLKEKNYNFLQMEEWLSSPNVDPYYKSILEVSSQRLFKVLRLNTFLKFATILIFIAICIILAYSFAPIFLQWANEYVTRGNILLILLLIITFFILRNRLYGSLNQSPAMRFLISIVPAIFISITGFICIGAYLIIFNRLFLYLGSSNFLKNRKKIKD